MKEKRAGLPILAFPHVAALEAWFASQARKAPGIWIKFAKRAAPTKSVTKAAAVDTALCHGWIDGKLENYDDLHWLVRFTPRRSGSKWSLLNRKRAAELMKRGRMRPAGLGQIKAAMADGRWGAAYPPARSAEVPGDLQDALNQNPKAAAFFKALSSRNRYAILYRIGAAKKTETRMRKIVEFVGMLERGETIHG